MGLLCSKLSCLLNWWGCCPCEAALQEAQKKQFKVLLLGATGSGKTQLGHLLGGEQRDVSDVDATNGVRCYRMKSDDEAEYNQSTLLLTEVGGSEDMQRIWSRYYATCHALIFCFDLSVTDEALQSNFKLLQRCLQHEALRGKAVLLVATQHRDGVQLYDVEHAFNLGELADNSGCPLHICYTACEDLWQGVNWLRRQLHAHEPTLAQRIKYDINMETWQQRKRRLFSNGQLAQVRRQRFRRKQRKLWPMPEGDDVTQPRPRTAPAAIFVLPAS